MDNVMLALKNRNIWLVSFNVFSCVLCLLRTYVFYTLSSMVPVWQYLLF